MPAAPRQRRKRAACGRTGRVFPECVRVRGALRAGVRGGWPFAVPLALGLCLRLAVIPSGPELDVAPLIGDEGNYVGIAETIAAGAGIPARWVWLRPPGYPLILAGLIRLCGRDLHPPLILQAFAGVATIAAAAALTWRLWGGRRATLLAAWATALNPSLIYYTRILHTETLYTLGATALVLALVWYAASAAPRRPHAVAGVLAGLTALLRPAIVAALPLLLVWLLLRQPRTDWRRAARHAALFLALFLATIAPNALHNWQAYGRYIPLDTTLGYIFWIDHRGVPRETVLDTLAAIHNPGDRHRRGARRECR